MQQTLSCNIISTSYLINQPTNQPTYTHTVIHTNPNHAHTHHSSTHINTPKIHTLTIHTLVWLKAGWINSNSVSPWRIPQGPRDVYPERPETYTLRVPQSSKRKGFNAWRGVHISNPVVIGDNWLSSGPNRTCTVHHRTPGPCSPPYTTVHLCTLPYTTVHHRTPPYTTAHHRTPPYTTVQQTSPDLPFISLRSSGTTYYIVHVQCTVYSTVQCKLHSQWSISIGGCSGTVLLFLFLLILSFSIISSLSLYKTSEIRSIRERQQKYHV